METQIVREVSQEVGTKAFNLAQFEQDIDDTFTSASLNRATAKQHIADALGDLPDRQADVAKERKDHLELVDSEDVTDTDFRTTLKDITSRKESLADEAAKLRKEARKEVKGKLNLAAVLETAAKLAMQEVPKMRAEIGIVPSKTVPQSVLNFVSR